MRDVRRMRTTLDIDDDVLRAAKELVEMKKKTAGQIISDLARQSLEPKRTYRVRNGVPVLPHRSGARLMSTKYEVRSTKFEVRDTPHLVLQTSYFLLVVLVLRNYLMNNISR